MSLPPCMQVPAAVHSAAGSYSSLVIGCTVAKRLVSKVLPDVARTCRMWRQFLPIYMRCKWTAWRYQESRGWPPKVCAMPLVWHSPWQREALGLHWQRLRRTQSTQELLYCYDCAEGARCPRLKRVHSQPYITTVSRSHIGSQMAVLV